MSDFFESFLTPAPLHPLNPIFTFDNPIFWGHFRPPPQKIGHHLCTLPKVPNIRVYSIKFFRLFPQPTIIRFWKSEIYPA